MAWFGSASVVRRCVAMLLIATTSDALAQRADDNAVTAAEDAFGATVGDESIGLYSSSLVRGFSPVTAGNVRIEGLYFDRQAWLPTRLVESSTVRVGLSAQGYPFPAPTGIVDYRLQKPDAESVVSLVVGLDPYAAPSIELDGKWPLRGEQFGVAAGLSYAHEEYYDGADANYWRAAFIPRWRPNESLDVIAFWGATHGSDEEVAPTIVTAGPWLPPQIARRRYFGQSWADNDLHNDHYGVLAKGRIGANWAIAGGIFRSVSRMPGSFADLYVDTQRDGLTRELLIADPPQHNAATSGEFKASRSFINGAQLHVIHASVRTRDQESLYGGSAAPLDLGERYLGERTPIPEPDTFVFSERTRDQVRQWTAGVSYEGRWRNVGEAILGLQKTDYQKEIDQPGLARVGTRDDPWLVSAALAAHLSPTLALYASYTRGLEESGVAPDSAANRNEALPAIRTQQVDAGVRWALRPDLKLVAGLFKVEKPYFTTDEDNVYTTMGRVEHRGIEVSLAGQLAPQLNAVIGVLLMDPRVTGEAVELGRVGDEPAGQTDRIVRANLEYRFPMFEPLSLDAGVTHYGDRVASSSGESVVPGYSLLDLGARYRVKLGAAPATLRVQALNVTDEYAWAVLSSNSFGLTDGRRYSAMLFVDF